MKDNWWKWHELKQTGGNWLHQCGHLAGGVWKVAEVVQCVGPLSLSIVEIAGSSLFSGEPLECLYCVHQT